MITMNSVLMNGRQTRQRIKKLIENYDKKIHDDHHHDDDAMATFGLNYFHPEQRTKMMKILLKYSIQIDELIVDIDLVEKNASWLNDIFLLNKRIINHIELLESIDLPIGDDKCDELCIDFRNQMLMRLTKLQRKMIWTFVKFLKHIIDTKLERNQLTNQTLLNNVVEYLDNVLQERIRPNFEFIIDIWNQIFDNDDSELNESNHDDSKMSELSDCYISASSSPSLDSIMNYDDNDDEREFSQKFSWPSEDDGMDFEYF